MKMSGKIIFKKKKLNYDLLNELKNSGNIYFGNDLEMHSNEVILKKLI